MGAHNTSHGLAFDFKLRGLMSRCEISTASLYKCNHISRLRTRSLEASHSLPGFHSQYSTYAHAAQEQKSRKMLIYLTGLVFAMVGCSYAAVPLYRRFCQATGYGGTIQRREVKIDLRVHLIKVWKMIENNTKFVREAGKRDV